MAEMRTITGLLLRGMLGGRRAWALAAMGLLPVVVAVAGGFGDVADNVYWGRLLQHLLLPVVVAFVAVILGAGALSASRDDGTILYLASTPVPRSTIVAAHILAAWVASAAILVPSIVVAHAVLLGPNPAATTLLWPLLGAMLAAAGYCAAAVWVALLLRHPVVACVLYILIWEGTLSGWSDTADRFSLAAYARLMASRAVADADPPNVPMALAVVVPVAVVAVAVVGGARSLQRRELP